MGSVLARTIVQGIRDTLIDQDQTVWTDTELLQYVSEGQQNIPRYKQDAYVVNGAVRLRAGTKQRLPADGLRLISITRNLGTDGRTPGRAVVVADLVTINREDPDWHQQPAAATVIELYYDPMDPKHFYVSPPQPTAGQGYVEMVYAAVPPALTTLDTPLAIDDIYRSSLVDYGCARALQKLGRGGDGARAQEFFNNYLTSLQAQEASEAASEPFAGGR